MSLKIKIYNQNAEATGEMEVSSKIFGVKANEALVHQAVVTQMANQRQVIAHTKDRSEVRGGGRKPWAQKGTGRARHGSSRSPIWIGGGITFGPRNDRNFKMRINKKMKQNALLMVLSDKAANDKIVILDKLEMSEYKTKVFSQFVAGFEAKVFTAEKAKTAKADKTEKTAKPKKRSLLVIVDKGDEKLNNSARNLPGVELINLDNINIVDILKYKNLILAKDVVVKLEERYK